MLSQRRRHKAEEETTEENKFALSLPGLQAALYHNQPLTLKLVWVFMFLSCTCICIKQVAERVEYFFTYPVNLAYEFESNESVSFPKITFCPQRPKETPTWDLQYEQLDAVNETASTMNTTTTPFKELFVNCSAGEECFKDEYWTEHMSVYGMAYTFHYAELSRKHHFWNVELLTAAQEIKKWKILLHDDEDDVTYGCSISSFIIEKDYLNGYIFTRSKIIYENVPIRPCEPYTTYKYCIINCLDKKVLNGNKCRLPFMKTVEHQPQCDTTQKIQIYKSFIKAVTHTSIVGECDCRRSCVEDRLTVDLDSRELVNATRITVASAMDEIETFEEKRSFVHYALFCEIGGIIGIYLGACLLTLIEAFQIMSVNAYKRVSKPLGKPFVQVKFKGRVINTNAQ